MKCVVALFLSLGLSSCALAAGNAVSYEVDGSAFEGHYISPAPDVPLVLLVHDWDGLTEYELKRSEMLSGLGYAVFVVDLFGAGVRPETLEERRRLTGELYADRELMRARLYGALEAARSQGGNTASVVAMGYCFGGTAVLELARSGA